MSGNKSGREPLDCSRVSIEKPEEMNYWCGKLCCTQKELARAIDEVGDSPDEVEKHLKKG